MDFDLDADQRALRDAARAFLEREAPISYARAMLDDPRGYRDDVWRKMADLGWMALPFPAESGGLGQGFVALAILLTEMGRVVLPGPYFSTVVLGGHAVAETGTESQRKEVVGQICSGDLVGTFADAPATVEACPVGNEYRLTGTARYVLDGGTAARVVIAAEDGDGAGVFLAEPRETVPVASMDGTRKVAHVIFDETPAERLGEGDAGDALRRIRDRACAGLAAEMLGAAERVAEMAVGYAKQRVQFDRPIGSFQAVKHRAADMHLEVESLRNAVHHAAWMIDRDHPDVSLTASLAKAYASDAFRRVAASGIQIHGGIGFTWEHDMHLYFKRAKGNEVAFGDATFHRERVAQLLRARA